MGRCRFVRRIGRIPGQPRPLALYRRNAGGEAAHRRSVIRLTPLSARPPRNADPLVILPLNVAHRRFRNQATVPARESLLPALLPLAGHGALRIDLPTRRPVTERIAVPRRLRGEGGQVELPPNRARPPPKFAHARSEQQRRP